MDYIDEDETKLEALAYLIVLSIALPMFVISQIIHGIREKIKK